MTWNAENPFYGCVPKYMIFRVRSNHLTNLNYLETELVGAIKVT